MKIIYCEQRSEEWFKAREGVITASSAGSVLFPGKRKTYMYALLSEIMTGQKNSFPRNEYMQWGIDHEDEARIWYEGISGNTVTEVGFCLRTDIERVGCSPDGLVGDEGLIEIKCPMSKTHIKYMMEGPPKDYVNQMQYQMWITDRAWCDFVTFDPRLPEQSRGHITRVPRDEAHIDKLRNCVEIMQKDMKEFLEENGCLDKWIKEVKE